MDIFLELFLLYSALKLTRPLCIEWPGIQIGNLTIFLKAFFNIFYGFVFGQLKIVFIFASAAKSKTTKITWKKTRFSNKTYLPYANKYSIETYITLNYIPNRNKLQQINFCLHFQKQFSIFYLVSFNLFFFFSFYKKKIKVISIMARK